MAIVELIARAHAAGLRILIDGADLVIRGPRSAGSIAEELIATKEKVLGVLDGNAKTKHEKKSANQNENDIIVPPRPRDQRGFVSEWTYVDGRYRWRYRREDAAVRAYCSVATGTDIQRPTTTHWSTPNRIPGWMGPIPPDVVRCHTCNAPKWVSPMGTRGCQACHRVIPQNSKWLIQQPRPPPR